MKRTYTGFLVLWLIALGPTGTFAQNTEENAPPPPSVPAFGPPPSAPGSTAPVFGPPPPVFGSPTPTSTPEPLGPPLAFTPVAPSVSQPFPPRTVTAVPTFPPPGAFQQSPPSLKETRTEPNTKALKGSSITKKEGKDLVNLDFVNADIAEITKSISELTKRNFIMDDKVHGKVTIISPKPVTSEEAYQAFISALAVQNFTVVPAGKMFKIVPLRDMKNNAIPTNVEAPLGGDDAFVTRLIPIRYIGSAEIVKSLRNLLSKNGDIISYDPTNTLIITDAVGNMRRVIKIITQLDRQGSQESLEVIRLKFASATDVADKIITLFDLKGGTRGQPATPGAQDVTSGAAPFISKILADDRSNSLIVMATPEGVRRVKEVVNTFDQSWPWKRKKAGSTFSTSSMRTPPSSSEPSPA